MLLTYKMLKDTTITLYGNQTIGPSVVGSLSKQSTIGASLTYTINSRSSLSFAASASPRQPPSDRFFADAYGRIARIMVALAVLAAPVLAWRLGARFALGFLCGAVVAVANFYWLKSGVNSLADVVTQTGARSSVAIVAKFMLRYGLLALIVYVILKGSGQGIYGFFAGLFVPVAAMVCEAAYEAWSALRHDI